MASVKSKLSAKSVKSDYKSTEAPPSSVRGGEYGAKEEFPETSQILSPPQPFEETPSAPVETEHVPVKRNSKWSTLIGRFTLVGYVLGLGNIIIFPEMYFRNGRLAFLIPLLLSYIFIGLPVLFLELIIGQVSALSPHKLFSRLAPMLSTIAGGMSIMTLYRSMYFMPFLAQIVFIAFQSTIRGEDAWGSCTSYNEYCVSLTTVLKCKHHWIGEEKTDMIQMEPDCQSAYAAIFAVVNASNSDKLPVLASTPHMQYLTGEVYRNVYATDEYFLWPGPWGVVLSLVLLWLLVAVQIFFGFSIVGYIGVAFTVIPILGAATFMLYSVAAYENSVDYLQVLLTADFTQLGQFQTWADAVSYVLFSLSLADGGVIKIASHHHYDNNLIIDVLFAIGADILVTFMYLITYVVSTCFVLVNLFPSGSDSLPSLMASPANSRLYSLTAFPDMVEATHESFGGRILVVGHFLSIILFGLPSMIVSLEMIIDAITDRVTKAVHSKNRQRWNRLIVTMLSCFILCCLTQLMITPGGHYLMHQILDNSINTLVVIAFMEVVAVVYFYGYKNFIQNIEAMLGVQSSFVHYIEAIIWNGVTPMACFGAFLARVVHSCYFDVVVLDYVVPVEMKLIMWLMFLVNVGIVPGYVAYKIIEMKRNKRYWRTLLKHDDAITRDFEVDTTESAPRTFSLLPFGKTVSSGTRNPTESATTTKAE